MNINELLEKVLHTIFSDPAEAEAYAENPEGYLAAAGVMDAELTGIDLGTVVTSVSNELDMGTQMSESLHAVGATPWAEDEAQAGPAPAPAAEAPAAQAAPAPARPATK